MEDLANYLETHYATPKTDSERMGSSRRSLLAAVAGLATGLGVSALLPTRNADALILELGGDKLNPDEFRWYKVKMGDSLRGLAQRFYGNENQWRDIMENNPDILDDKNLVLHPGVKIRINYTRAESHLMKGLDSQFVSDSYGAPVKTYPPD